MEYFVALPSLSAPFTRALTFLALLLSTPIAQAEITTGIGEHVGHGNGIARVIALVPEPSTWAALLLGASILILRSRKRRA